ncbi:PREDICTED: uncharacterized protein LOC104737727 isoform X3 [Camelina sativa]|uniref:Uncharacterized protein LOC104737727 isoform X3 n=1 Tax=Camelina sativa TaxID=90675 RepID=A0ABM0VHM9_CAMSA|nr:PREDICTED: uncharacterized protein LOC104737727 isoform X3 [Camelina sativa]
MNTESVVEFLGNVSLLQRLPSSSLKRIAQVVVFKRYVTDRGDYVVRENQDVDGVYFLLEGQAQVLISAGEEFLLKRFDFFGHGIFGDVYPADVVARSELTCLLLMSDHLALLETKYVWDSDKELESPCLVEHILYLEPLDVRISPLDCPSFCSISVLECIPGVHSTQCSNLWKGLWRAVSWTVPIIFEVNRLRDGNNFSTRRVDARQKGKTIFTLFASFQRKQQGFIHQESTMPHTPAPETLLPREEILERLVTDPLLPRDYRDEVATEINVPFPIDIRFCEPKDSTKQTKSSPRLKYWFRAKGKLSDDDQALHRCVVAYASDLIFASISLNPHRREGMSVAALSLDHSMWFHRSIRADDWLLFVMVSPTVFDSRGFATGKMFNRKGELVASLTQEALVKEAVNIKPSFGAKL